ncbi:response regulator transcription factor [Streptomyces millisiae]|uniref:Response regulator transcription factor n=1 Tax=Streptomyces millisiae TaxID=3075542 RepID=A0ABU2LN28_9ACTN|nr:response regulator transcription factor [Streptomyces sp. DSM 44918]MDT0318953.1 response regulator transcription factor [Streptomyces sp. DSM 44918]
MTHEPRRTGALARDGGTPPPTRGAGQHVLVVAPDPGTHELLATTLHLAGYRVGTAGTRAEALARVAEHRFDLVVVDVVLPDGTDFTVFRHRARGRPRVLLLTAHETLSSVVPRLGDGVDDYVTKPFRVAEVLARAHVLLRRGGPTRAEPPPGYADLTLDDVTCRARRGGRALDLTPAEYRLLRYLLANAEQVITKEQIRYHVWGEFRGDNAIEKLVSRLRRKVNQHEPALIHTRRGFGYWLGRA